MNQELQIPTEISTEEWERTPESVKLLVKHLVENFGKRIAALEEENRYLREQIGRNSGNSSQPPSADGPEDKPQKKQSSGKRRGGQKGHPGYRRELIAIEECQKVENYLPKHCRKCGEELRGTDPSPYRHQVVEIPEIKPYVEEHRLHQLECSRCGTLTRAALPPEVTVSGYGVRVVAIVAILSGFYRLSERMLQQSIKDLFGVTLALGTVNGLRQEASQAVAKPVEQAAKYVKKQRIINSDETGFSQGNGDGKNPEQRKAWLWVAVTACVTVFHVTLSRSQLAAQEFLGVAIRAILITDRWNAYNWLKVRRRQLCWAHLKRDFTKMAERRGESGRIGKQLLEQEKLLFTYWHRVRDGTLTRSSFRIYAGQIRGRVKALLQQGAAYHPQKGEQTVRARTARTCQELLKLEPAMWLFVRVKGLEPTNNAAERAIRHFVLWRKNSFGAQSADGSLFVARMLSVVMTLRSQNRNILDYFLQACQAAREGKAAPSILPSAA